MDAYKPKHAKPAEPPKPVAVCPFCEETPGVACPLCDGNGWLPLVPV